MRALRRFAARIRWLPFLAPRACAGSATGTLAGSHYGALFDPLRRSIVVGIHLKEREAVIDVRVTDTEVEPDPRTAGVERVVGGGDDFDAVDEPAQHVALDGGLDEVAVLDAVAGTGQLRERGEVCDRAVPPDDLRVGRWGLQAPEEHLVARAHVRGYRAAQPYLDLLEVFLGLVAAEHRALHVLVGAPLAGQHRRRIVVVAFGRGVVFLAEVALLDPAFGLGHAGSRAVRDAVADHDVRPVDALALAVDPQAAIGDRILVGGEARAIGPYRFAQLGHASPSGLITSAPAAVSVRSSMISPALCSQVSPPRSFRMARMATPISIQMPTMNGDQLLGEAGNGLNDLISE